MKTAMQELKVRLIRDKKIFPDYHEYIDGIISDIDNELLEEEKNQLIDAWETGELFGERVERDGMNYKRVMEVRNEFITGKTYNQ